MNIYDNPIQQENFLLTGLKISMMDKAKLFYDMRINQLPPYYKKVFPDFESVHKRNELAYIFMAESYDKRQKKFNSQEKKC